MISIKWIRQYSLLALLLGNMEVKAAEQYIFNQPVTPKELESKLTAIIGNEIQVSLNALKVPGAKPDSILGEAISGEYNWPSFIYTLAKYQMLSKSEVLGSHNLMKWISAYFTRPDLSTANTFSQLYYLHTLLLLSKGVQTRESNFFNQFDKSIQEEIILASDYSRSFDIHAMRPTNGRPRNFVAVAALTEAYAIKNGFTKNNTVIKSLLADILSHLQSNEGYLDDDYKGHGRFDRYNFEYLRFAYMAADLAGEMGAKKDLLPFVKQSAALWWQMFNHETGHSVPYGRSLQNAWDDTFEQSAFYAQYPETSPTTLPQLGAAFINGVNKWFFSEYNFQTHLNRMLDPGRSTWSYAGRNRIWSYTFHSLGKMAYSARVIIDALIKNKVQSVNITPLLGEVNCFFPFIQDQGTQGVWVYRKGSIYFNLPIVNGLEACQSADYAPIPYGLPGVGFMVNEQINNYIPYFKTKSGRYYTISGKADHVQFDDQSQTLDVEYHHIWPLDKKGMGIPLMIKATFTAHQLPHFSLTGEYAFLSNVPDSLQAIEVSGLVNLPEFDANTDIYQDGQKSLMLSITSMLPYTISNQQLNPGNKEYKGAFGANFHKKTLIINPLAGVGEDVIFFATQWTVKNL